MFQIKRSPAKVCWHLLYNGILVYPSTVKQECIDKQREFSMKFGV